MTLQKPPLYSAHRDTDADFTDFGGWKMPVSFDSIRTEHTAVRETAGRFDVSHMGEVVVRGPDATELMDRLTTNAVGELEPGDAQYTCILDENGILLDDTVVYRRPERNGYLFVPNAGHDEQMTNRWRRCAADNDLDATVENVTDETGMIAIQGPEAVDAVSSLASDPVSDLSRFRARRSAIGGVDSLVARTGYTGEDGFEIMFPATDAESVWGAFEDIQRCGLGARDTLRLEAGLLLSGEDFDPEHEPRTPLEAGLEFVVDFSTTFVGADALRDLEVEGVDEELVGLRVNERAIARPGYSIVADGTEVGAVTSGTMSPTLGVPIALGYVDTAYTDEGTEVGIEVRDSVADATIVDQRFLETQEGDT